MGKFTEFNVPLKGMSPGEHTLNFHLDKKFFDNMENTDIHDANLDVKLLINYRADKYDMLFQISGEVVLLCDRCLDDLCFPIDTEYKIMVEYGSGYEDSDDLLIIPSSDSNLNVAYMIYDTVVLAIPIKHVHPLGKCNRQMSALLHKHRAKSDDEDAEFENELIDEMDSMEAAEE